MPVPFNPEAAFELLALAGLLALVVGFEGLGAPEAGLFGLVAAVVIVVAGG
jgi:hypothetical protein